MKRASRSGAHHEHDGMLGEGRDGLEWPDHGEARSTVVRPAVRKKSVDIEFPAILGDQGWLAVFARKRRSWDGLYQEGNGARSTAKAQRSYGNGGGGENRGRKMTTMASRYL